MSTLAAPIAAWGRKKLLTRLYVVFGLSGFLSVAFHVCCGIIHGFIAYICAISVG